MRRRIRGRPGLRESIYIYNMSPKFWASASISGSMAIPKCPAMMPTKNTNVTPRDIPNTFIFPRASPVALISDRIITAWMNVCWVNSSVNQFMSVLINDESSQRSEAYDTERTGFLEIKGNECDQAQGVAFPVYEVFRSGNTDYRCSDKSQDCWL